MCITHLTVTSCPWKSFINSTAYLPSSVPTVSCRRGTARASPYRALESASIGYMHTRSTDYSVYCCVCSNVYNLQEQVFVCSSVSYTSGYRESDRESETCKRGGRKREKASGQRRVMSNSYYSMLRRQLYSLSAAVHRAAA